MSCRNYDFYRHSQKWNTVICFFFIQLFFMSKYFMSKYFSKIIFVSSRKLFYTSQLLRCHPGREGDLLLYERLLYLHSYMDSYYWRGFSALPVCWSNSCRGHACWQWPLFCLRYRWSNITLRRWSLDNKHSCRQLYSHTSDRSKYSYEKFHCKKILGTKFLSSQCQFDNEKKSKLRYAHFGGTAWV